MADESGQPDEIRMLEEHLASHPDSERFAELAALLVAAGRSRDALRVCERGMGFHPGLAAGHLMYGKALVALGQLEDGIKAFERACTLRNNDAGTWAEVGQFLAEHGQPQAAFPYLKRAVALDPVDPRVLRLEAKLEGPPLADHERLVTEPFQLEGESEGEPLELSEESTAVEEEWQDPTLKTAWPAWDSNPPPPVDSAPPAPAVSLSEDEFDEPPTLYTDSPLATPGVAPGREGAPGGGPDSAAGEGQSAGTGAGVHPEASNAIEPIDRRPLAEPPTMFDSSGGGPAPWQVEANFSPAVERQEPPTLYQDSTKASAQAAPPPTQFATSPEGALAAPPVVVPSASSFSYVKVFLVLIPFLVAGLGLGVYVAYSHIHAEKINDLIEQAASSMALDTLSGYNDARSSLDQLFSLDGQNRRGKALQAVISARISDEYGPNLAQRDEARRLIEEAQQQQQQQQQQPDTRIDLLWAKFHLSGAADETLRGEIDGALKQLPDDARLLDLAGEMVLRQGRTEPGREYLKRCLERDPTNLRALFALGSYAQQAGQLKEAADLYSRALTVNGLHVATLLAYSRLRLERKSELDQARADLGKLVELPQVTDRQKAEAHLLLAHLAFLVPERSRALSEVKAANDLTPEDGPFQTRLAKLCLQFFELDETSSRVKKLLQDSPNEVELKLLAIQAELPRGHWTDALKALDALVGQKVPAGPFFLLRGEAQLLAKRFGPALDDFSKVPAEFAGKTRGRALSVLAMLGLGEVEKARREAAALLKDFAEDAMANYAMGKVYLANRQARSGAEAMAKAVESDPRCYQALFELALMALEHKNDAQAAELLERAMAANPFDAESRYLLGTIKLRSGDSAGAIDAFARVVVDQPGHGGAWVGLAEALLAQGKTDKARIAIESAKKAGADDAHARHVEGKVYLALGRFFQAVRVLKSADDLRANDADILADLGFAQLGVRNFGQAEKSLRKSLHLRRMARPQEGLAELLVLKGKFADAAAAYEVAATMAKARKAKPEEIAKLYMEGGKALLKQGTSSGLLQQARRLFNLAAKVVPEDPEPLFQVAATWDRDDKVAQARGNYEKVLALDPNHQETLFRLGLLEFDQKNEARAKELLEKYLASDPKGALAKRAKDVIKRIK